MVGKTELPQFPSLDIFSSGVEWGPTGIPESFKDMPYQPFAKDARLGKVADWSGVVYTDNKAKNRYTSHFGGAQYTYYHNEDESNFQMVSGGKDQKNNMMRHRFRLPMYRNRRAGYPGAMGGARGKIMPNGRPMTDREAQFMAQQGSGAQAQTRRWGGQGGGGGGTGAQPVNWTRGGMRGGYRGRGGYGNYGNYGNNGQGRQPSVPVLDSWSVVEEMDFARLAKLTLPNIAEPLDIVQCGEMEYYDKSYDKVTTKNEVPLQRHNRVVHKVKAGQDPIFKRLANQATGNVYMSDASAAAIMCCTRSVYSWDLIVQKEAGCLFIDRRGSGDISTQDQRCHLISVCETAGEPPSEDSSMGVNSAGELALEATYINDNFTQQVLDSSNNRKYSFPEKNPFWSEDDDDGAELQSVGYRYRTLELGNDIKVVMRCEVDGVLSGTGTKKKAAQFTYIRALNEFDSKSFGSVDWRSKLDTQRGAVLASELKNNAYKLAKWTVCALMAGADQFHLGFVSRVNPRNTSMHTILGILQYKPEEFGQQINLNMDNAWAILRCVIDTFMKLPDGKYLFLKDPNKGQLRIYSVPRDAFEDSDDDDEDDDEEEEEEVPEKVEDEKASFEEVKEVDSEVKTKEEQKKASPSSEKKPDDADMSKDNVAAKAESNKPTPVLKQADPSGQTFKAKRVARN